MENYLNDDNNDLLGKEISGSFEIYSNFKFVKRYVYMKLFKICKISFFIKFFFFFFFTVFYGKDEFLKKKQSFQISFDLHRY